MKIMNVHQAKTHLSKILSEVEKGEEYIIARAGKAVARLSPVGPSVSEPIPGRWRGLVTVHEDFDSEDERINRTFEGDDGEIPR